MTGARSAPGGGPREIRLLEPPPRCADTGGYRFNARIGERLASERRGGVVRATAGRLLAELDDVARRAAVAVVDSLLLGEVDPPARIDDAPLLLMHLPPDADPALDDATRRHLAERTAGWIARSRGVITTSPRLARTLVERHRGLIARAVLPGVEAFFRPAPAERAPGTTPTLVAVGSLVPRKGQQQLATIGSRIAHRGTRLRLILIGDDRADERYTREVRDAATGLDLTITGAVPAAQVARALQRADVFVAFASVETYGMAAAEAAACGLPIVSTAAGEIDRWIDDGRDGFVVEPGDATAFEDRVVRVLADLDGFASRARARPCRPPSWEQASAAWIAAVDAWDAG